MWHGTEDRNVPLGMAQYMADRLPNCTPNFVKGAGHFLSLESHSEIINVIIKTSILGVENAIK